MKQRNTGISSTAQEKVEIAKKRDLSGVLTNLENKMLKAFKKSVKN